MVKVPFAEWRPDDAVLGSAYASEALNVFPRTERSYGPVSDLSAYSSALGARCQGAFSARKNSTGDVYTFAGDATKLYLLSGATFEDVSQAGGYITGAEEAWVFAQFGDLVIATNFSDPIQVYDLGTLPATFSDLSADAPRARYLAVIRDFLVVGNTYDSVDGYRPSRVWWSAIADATSWPAPGTTAAASAMSDYQDLPSGGWVQSILGAIGGADGAVFADNSIYRMQFEGPPTVFRFDEVERARGTPAPGSVVSTGALAAYQAEDGFYVFDGAISQPIGFEKVDRWFFDLVDQSFYSRITSAVDPINKLVLWSFPSVGAAGVPDTLLIWNWQLNRWSHAELTCEAIFRARSAGVTLDGLDALYPGGLDTIPFSLDSRVWTGGRLILGAFDNAHKLAFSTGTTLAATLETGEFDGDGRRLYVDGIRPLVDGGTVTASVGYRDTQSESVSYTTATSAGADGVCPQRISTRYARARVSIAAGGAWNHAQGVEPVVRKEGRR